MVKLVKKAKKPAVDQTTQELINSINRKLFAIINDRLDSEVRRLTFRELLQAIATMWRIEEGLSDEPDTAGSAVRKYEAAFQPHDAGGPADNSGLAIDDEPDPDDEPIETDPTAQH